MPFFYKKILVLFFTNWLLKMIAGIAAGHFIICQDRLTDKLYKRIGRLRGVAL
jgi:hypothetical protein